MSTFVRRAGGSAHKNFPVRREREDKTEAL